MNCKRIQELILTDYLDDELNRAQKNNLEAHLSTCQECREYAAVARTAVIEPFTHAQRAEVPEQIWGKIRESMNEQRKSAISVLTVPWWQRFKEFLTPPQPVLAMAMTGIIIMVFVVASYNQRKNDLSREEIEDMSYIVEEFVMISQENDFEAETDIEAYFL